MIIRFNIQIISLVGLFLISVTRFINPPIDLYQQETSTVTVTVTGSATESITPSGTLTITETSSLTPTSTVTITASPSPIQISATATDQPTTTWTPVSQASATPVVIPTATPGGTLTPPADSTATLVPFPTITYIFPNTTSTQELLVIERQPDAQVKLNDQRTIFWRRLLELWPIVLIALVWIIIAMWFVIVRSRSG
jgi:hypothetical protein